MEKSKELGQLNIGELIGPVKARVSGRFIPDFTIDLTRPPTAQEKVGAISLIKPKITFLIAGKAYTLEWGQTSVKETDPKIFEQTTFFDTISKIGVFPILIFAGATIFTIYSLVRRIS